MLKVTSIIVLISCIIAISSNPANAQWRDLFNGKDLTGWEQKGGTALYFVRDGVLYGETVPNTPNSFLTTTETYSDFILEVEVKVHDALNSGVQFRSEVSGGGQVFGYQMEIDPSSRAWSGGIYDEARRGWLVPLAENEAARRAFRNNDWNVMRVEAIGTSIRTFVNGVEATSILDSTTPRGFIALQVHDIGQDESKRGIQVAFRSVRIQTENVKGNVTSLSDLKQANFLPNVLSEQEIKDGWKLLWDGKTTDGWRGARLSGFPERGWNIENGILSVLPSGGGESAHGGDIITTKKYSNYVLIVDFRITEGANSGIKYVVDPTLNQGQGSSIGCEFQILDDQRHPDAKLGVNGNRTVASLYDLIPARNKRFSGVGQWNRARVVVRGAHIEHSLNGMKVLEFERGTQMWDALVDYSKFSIYPGFCGSESGHILLQDHGDRVDFRSIKIKEL